MTEEPSPSPGNQTEILRGMPLERKSELLCTARPNRESGSPAGPTDDAEQIAASHEEYISLSLSNLACEELQLIDDALDRIQTGGYGVCLECGASIAQKRLQSVPWARFCLSCEQQMES
jgi:DnaK suppressor protein